MQETQGQKKKKRANKPDSSYLVDTSKLVKTTSTSSATKKTESCFMFI